MKKDWGYWRQLISGETGLGWDHVKQMIAADDMWWERKLKNLPSQCAKFREKGIIMPEEQEMLFNDVYATGENSWTPSASVLLAHMCEQYNTDDVEEATEEAVRDDIDGDGDTSHETTNFKKRQLPKSSKEQNVKKKSRAEGLKDSLDKIVEAVATSTATVSSIRGGMPGSTIVEVLEILGHYPES